MTPKISVLMSVFNGQPYLKEAVTSILEQSFFNFEFIVIDDASRDKSLMVLKSFNDSRIRIIKNTRRLGLTKSLNRGLSQTNGEFVARMDADDISCKNRLKIQVSHLTKNPEIAFCGSWASLIDQSGKKIGEKRHPLEYQEIKKAILRYSPFVHPSVMIRKKILEKVGFYSSDLNGAEDYDLFLRIVSRYQAVNLPHFLLKYRINPQGVSYRQYKKTEKQALKARWKAITQYGYPVWQLIYLVKPVISFLIPEFLKRYFYRQHFKL